MLYVFGKGMKNMQNIQNTQNMHNMHNLQSTKTVRVQHITLFSYSEFHEANLNHQETIDEWTQNVIKQSNIQTTGLSWYFHFLNIWE